jgi:hypothetical protein
MDGIAVVVTDTAGEVVVDLVLHPTDITRKSAAKNLAIALE